MEFVVCVETTPCSADACMGYWPGLLFTRSGVVGTYRWSFPGLSKNWRLFSIPEKKLLGIGWNLLKYPQWNRMCCVKFRNLAAFSAWKLPIWSKTWKSKYSTNKSPDPQRRPALDPDLFCKRLYPILTHEDRTDSSRNLLKALKSVPIPAAKERWCRQRKQPFPVVVFLFFLSSEIVRAQW